MTNFINNLEPAYSDPAWISARKALAASETTLIAHIDAGLFPHPGIGATDRHSLPANILLRRGRNFHDPVTGPQKLAPWTYLTGRDGAVARFTEYPGHGVGTLSVILSDTPELKGVAPGARIIPYRVSNGPLFHEGAGPHFEDAEATALIGRAIIHAIDQRPAASVIAIPLGNPGWIGPLGGFILGSPGGSHGMARETGLAINRAYDRGIIVCAAAGEVRRDVVYPARFGRTISVAGYEHDGTHYTHYPKGGYGTGNAFVDTWAQASGLNHATGTRRPDGRIRPGWATGDADADPSGTAYAAAFVAGAAALWVETHAETLAAPAFSGRENAWRRVEAFRHILNSVMPAQQMRSGRADVDPIATRPLDIPRLLNTAPDPDLPYRKRPKWGRGLF